MVVADDLTGAAEIAALGFRHGLRSVVATGPASQPIQADLVVHDTDSRLDLPGIAARKLATLGERLRPLPSGLIYKKTDSVLRGSVRLEVESLARALGRTRVLLLPANPTLGRTIRDGRYEIDGVPLDRTAFARDPHHPARSADVLHLLGEAGEFPVAVRSVTDPLPDRGLILANAASASEVHAWAQLATAVDLPAGGAEFFSALLSRSHPISPAPPANFPPDSPTLIVSGTTSSAGVALRAAARRDGLAIVPMPAQIAAGVQDQAAATDEWIEAVRSRLMKAGLAIVLHDGPVVDDPRVASAIRGALAECTGRLTSRGVVRHLVVEGGATAAAIARRSGWSELCMVHEWAQGVASLRPAIQGSLLMTMKPGSYAWPSLLWRHLLASRREGDGPLPIAAS